MVLSFFLYSCDEFVASFFYEVNGIFEGGGIAVVRVGDEGGATVWEEFAHVHYFFFIFCRARLAQQAALNAVVHSDDAVERIEVGAAEGAGAMCQPIATRRGTAAHARVGEFAFMIVDEACRVASDLKASGGGANAHDFFGSRRAANVSKADKEQAGHWCAII